MATDSNVKVPKVKTQSRGHTGLVYIWKTALGRKALLLPQGFLTQYGFFNSWWNMFHTPLQTIKYQILHYVA